MPERGYPKSTTSRIADLQRSARQYRGRQTATQWIYVSQSRRGGLGYVDFESPWGDADDDAPAQFCMDEHGRVRLRGRISGGSVGSVAFYLPTGFKPPIPQSFVLSNGNSGYANVEVGTDGAATVTGVT